MFRIFHSRSGLYVTPARPTPLSAPLRPTLVLALSLLMTANTAVGAVAPVVLGSAGNFAVLAKSGISTVPPSSVVGDIGVSPIDSTAITGFSLTLDSSGQFAESPQVTGRIYAPDFASPTATTLTTAVADMETAYTDAAGRSLPDFTELGAGDIGGMTLAPGLYKWGTGLLIPSNVTLSGGPDDIWIFQIAGNLTVAEGKAVILRGGAQARNIFWQVAGGVGVELGTTSHFEGILLAQAAISLRTGASINGRLLAQTAVTLDGNSVVAHTASTVRLLSAVQLTGPYVDVASQTWDPATRTLSAPQSGDLRFYRLTADTSLMILSIAVEQGTVVIRHD
jgi:hypothetical protein